MSFCVLFNFLMIWMNASKDILSYYRIVVHAPHEGGVGSCWKNKQIKTELLLLFKELCVPIKSS